MAEEAETSTEIDVVVVETSTEEVEETSEIEDLTKEEMTETVVDSAEETDPDLVLQETSEALQEDNMTMTSEEDQIEERDPDPVAEMDLHTVENGIVMRTDILSEEA